MSEEDKALEGAAAALELSAEVVARARGEARVEERPGLRSPAHQASWDAERAREAALFAEVMAATHWHGVSASSALRMIAESALNIGPGATEVKDTPRAKLLKIAALALVGVSTLDRAVPR